MRRPWRNRTVSHWWHCDPTQAFCGWPLTGASLDDGFDETRDEFDCQACVIIYYTVGCCPICDGKADPQ